jgi:hypothetical protein
LDVPLFPWTETEDLVEIFCDWCSGRDIDPVRVTVQQLADFLVYLFEIKRLVPSTIKGYRSAIGRTISLLGCTTFPLNWDRRSRLKGSFRGLAQDRSRSSGNHACLGQAGAIRMILQSDCLILRTLFNS